jgi:hypothetical protein
MGLVTYVYSSKPLSVPGYASKVDEMLAKLNKKAQDDGLNITLKIKWLPKPYDLEAAREGGDDYDCDVYYTSIEQAQELFEEGYILRLNDLVKEKTPDYYSMLMTRPYMKKALGIDDYDEFPLCFLPSNRVGSNIYYVMMEKEIAEKYDIKISSIEDYVDALGKIKEGGEPKTPGNFNTLYFLDEYMRDRGYYQFLSVLFYAKYDDPSYNVYSAADVDDFYQLMELLKRIFSEKFAEDSIDIYKALALGQTSSIIDNPGLWMMTKYTFRKDKEYAVFPLTSNNDYLRLGSGLVIGSSAQNPERIMTFINWLYSDQENMDIWLYGGFENEKNDFYTLDEKGRILYNKPTDPFYEWLGTAGDILFDMRLARVPYYLPENFVEIYEESLNKTTLEKKLSNPSYMLEPGTPEYEDWSKLGDLSQYNPLIRTFWQVCTDPKFDVNGFIKEMKSADLDDIAKKMSDFLNEALE